ncbi:unnamed protein product [Prorocentrum cordatum]|uniref:Uncharacterized protein n=1 Tax=Prorocentrum cordatum TaxID=2364126 RepID=A0ABN9UDG7_9DINO|nr:unnamed protein product [Polarella glacialis]
MRSPGSSTWPAARTLCRMTRAAMQQWGSSYLSKINRLTVNGSCRASAKQLLDAQLRDGTRIMSAGEVTLRSEQAIIQASQRSRRRGWHVSPGSFGRRGVRRGSPTERRLSVLTERSYMSCEHHTSRQQGPGAQ